jgi:hypothetical protein
MWSWRRRREDDVGKGTYNASPRLVSSSLILQKAPCCGLETEAASSHETTGAARAPRWRRRLHQRCMARLFDSTTTGSRARALSSLSSVALTPPPHHSSPSSTPPWILVVAAPLAGTVGEKAAAATEKTSSSYG